MYKRLLSLVALLAMAGMAMAQDISAVRQSDGSWGFTISGVPDGWLVVAAGDTVTLTAGVTTPITTGAPISLIPPENLRHRIKSVTLVDAAPLAPTGAINALFSISATQQVYFSQGNLQATTTDNGGTWTWSFATNQYDTIGNAVANTAVNGNGTVSTNGTVDLFGWSTAATVYGIHNSESDVYSGDFVEWGNNAIANGGNTANSGWRTLTKDEWVYLFNTRTDAASKKGHGKVNGVNGIILLPDEWTLPSGLTFTPGNSRWGNVYTTEQWAQMEAGGAVFLPAAGNRQSTGPAFSGDRGYYWSSTANGSTTSYLMFFATTIVMPQTSAERYFGQSVRLVHDNN